jgi:hypothetical protein
LIVDCLGDLVCDFGVLRVDFSVIGNRIES